jgi:hypothetical protein
MAKISFGSPWMAVGAGLSQGVGQGLMFGMELAERKRAAKQKLDHDSISLLMQGMKNAPDNSEDAPKYWEAFNQLYEQISGGKKIPPALMAQAQPWALKYKKAEAEIKAAFPDRPQEWIDNVVLQKFKMKPLKGATEEKAVPFFRDGKWIGNHKPSQVNPNSGATPAKPWRPDTPVNFLPYDPSNPPQGSFPRGTHAVPIKQPETTIERDAPISETEQKTFKEVHEENLKAAKTPEDKARVIAEIKKRGGDVTSLKGEPGPPGLGWLMGKPGKDIVIPPSTRKSVTVKQPGLPGAKGKDAAYQKFKQAYALDPDAAVKASKVRGDGFAERVQKEGM